MAVNPRTVYKERYFGRALREAIGKRIEERVWKNESEAAIKMEMTATRLSNYIYGKSLPDDDVLGQLEPLGVPVGEWRHLILLDRLGHWINEQDLGMGAFRGLVRELDARREAGELTWIPD